MRVLVIDDSPSIITHIRQLLGAHGHTVESLELFVHLPDRLKHDPPDLIVLDLNMPALPGIAMGGLIKRYQPREIPIIVYSSQPRPELEAAARKLNAAGCVQKGDPPECLIEAVDKVKELIEAR
jgi:DNA-binding NarL/FixJ family response regulator